LCYKNKMRAPALLSLALLLLAPAAPQAAQPSRAALEEAVQKARAAHDAKDYPALLRWSERVAGLAPHSTRALYNLACAHALSGHAAQSIALLDRLTRMGVATGAEKDADFDGIRAQPAFQAVLERAKTLAARVGSSPVAFTLPETDLITEGLAYDPRTKAFFVSSVRKRKVVRRDAAGAVSDFTRPTDNLMSVVGLAVDEKERSLWLTTAAFPQMEGFRKKEDAGRSLLVEYDLDHGTVRRRLPPPLASAMLSDLALGPRGDVFVADPSTGRIYVLRHGRLQLSVLVDEGPIGSAQGLAPAPDGRFLFVADYAQGVVRVDTASGATLLLPAPADAAVTGIDGLVWTPGGLIGVQNGLQPHRVVRLALDRSRSRITAVETLERHHPEFDEPTLATVVDGDVYYVANSQYGKVDDAGQIDREHLRPPAILRLRPPR
jgi:sugar lactone lactonase YvrE